MIDSIQDRRVLVMGGSGGIGQAIVRRLADKGAHVIVGCNSRCMSAELFPENLALQDRLEVLKLDLLDEDEIFRVQLPDIDTLVYCAGLSSPALISGCQKDELHNQFAIHVIAPILLVQRLLSQARTPLRDVVLVSSTAGVRLAVNGGVYALTKSGTIALARLLSQELRPRGIRVNAIAPGWTDTTMARDVLETRGSSLEKLKSTMVGNAIVAPEEVAALCASILSDELPHLQGQVIVVEPISK